MSSKYALNPHALVRFLEKDAKDFTKDDIIRYVTENEIEMINFRYPGADGRLKTLNFIINSPERLWLGKISQRSKSQPTDLCCFHCAVHFMMIPPCS